MKGINYGRFISMYQSQDGGICIITHPFLTMFYPLLQVLFSLLAFDSEKSLFTTRSVVNAVVKKKACVEPGLCLTTIFVGPGNKAKRNGYPFF